MWFRVLYIYIYIFFFFGGGGGNCILCAKKDFCLFSVSVRAGGGLSVCEFPGGPMLLSLQGSGLV